MLTNQWMEATTDFSFRQVVNVMKEYGALIHNCNKCGCKYTEPNYIRTDIYRPDNRLNYVPQKSRFYLTTERPGVFNFHAAIYKPGPDSYNGHFKIESHWVLEEDLPNFKIQPITGSHTPRIGAIPIYKFYGVPKETFYRRHNQQVTFLYWCNCTE